jgi:acyl-CoA reductase-like NAD-dependent aldehyde dehydrogenase
LFDVCFFGALDPHVQTRPKLSIEDSSLNKMATPDFSTFRNVIAGSLRSSPTMGHSIDPSTRKPLWDVPIATVSDLNDAVTAAQAAFLEWSRLSWKDRQAHLRQIQSLLIQHRPSMARLVSSEGGKPPQFGDLEVQHALDFLEFYSGSQAPLPGGSLLQL